MKHMIVITLFTVFLGFGYAAAQHTDLSPLPRESQCSEMKYHDFYVGTISTYCEPAQGKITVYEHTYTNGFTIFDSDGDSRVDSYCSLHGCLERTEIPHLSATWQKHENLFFESWDKVLKSMPSTIIADRGDSRPFFASDADPRVRVHQLCALDGRENELFGELVFDKPLAVLR